MEDNKIRHIFKGSHWLLQLGPWKSARVEGGKPVRGAVGPERLTVGLE